MKKWINITGLEMRVKISKDKLKEAEMMYGDFIRDGYFYRGTQYLGSFIRRANTIVYDSTGHDSYGSAEIEIALPE